MTFINIIPGFHHDQAVQRADGRQYRSNLSAVVDVLVLRIFLDDIRVPLTASEYAQHDLSCR